MDSSLEALERKGNLASAPALYNPSGVAEALVHFTPSHADVRFAARLANHRIEVFPYLDPPEAGPRLLRALRAFARVYGKIRRERVNLIRGRLPYLGSLLGCLAGRLLGIPSIVSLGGDNRIAQEESGVYHLGSRRLSYAVEWLVLRLCNVVIAPNVFTKDYVARLIGVRRAEAKVAVIPWRVDLSSGPSAENLFEGLGLDPRRPLLLVVGFLNRYKLTDVMYDVAERVVEDGRAIMVFCGDGPLRGEGEARFAGRSAVQFLGWQPHGVVHTLLRHATAVLVPMSGFVLLEAAGEGKAVVASDLEWHGEIVEDGVSGFLVEARRPDRWAERALALIDDSDLTARLGASLRARFDAEYDPQLIVEREANLYRSLLPGGRA